MPRGVCTLTVLNEKDSYIGEQCTAYHLTALLFWLHSGWYEKIHEKGTVKRTSYLYAGVPICTSEDTLYVVQTVLKLTSQFRD